MTAATTTCVDCTSAESRLWHTYRAKCPDCQVRMLAMSPRHIREAAYDHLEKNVGIEARQTLVRRVKAEQQRIAAVKGKK